jgi:hypothetical protein
MIRSDAAMKVSDPAYADALKDLRRNSDTRWSPWRMIDGNDEAAATIAALSAIADAWGEAMPAEPPHIVNDPITGPDSRSPSPRSFSRRPAA